MSVPIRSGASVRIHSMGNLSFPLQTTHSLWETSLVCLNNQLIDYSFQILIRQCQFVCGA